MVVIHGCSGISFVVVVILGYTVLHTTRVVAVATLCGILIFGYYSEAFDLRGTWVVGFDEDPV